ncbi:hypothetical protein CYOC110262_19735 [Cytobacillus oceanisediminis]|uniref:Uncharacterized protein n=1 Tax=Cytobacillus oceanisediminis TaxID=665099 RepID=A0A562K0K5_9BACI|nr:hypothetical protein IQ19_01384 [Cytobacillus oceanisediminis]
MNYFHTEPFLLNFKTPLKGASKEHDEIYKEVELVLTLSRSLMLQTKLVGNHCDEFRIRWLGFCHADCITEQ